MGGSNYAPFRRVECTPSTYLHYPHYINSCQVYFTFMLNDHTQPWLTALGRKQNTVQWSNSHLANRSISNTFSKSIHISPRAGGVWWIGVCYSRLLCFLYKGKVNVYIINREKLMQGTSISEINLMLPERHLQQTAVIVKHFTRVSSVSATLCHVHKKATITKFHNE